MKNGELVSLRSRVEALEKEVVRLKSMLATSPAQDEPWWKAIVGTHKDDQAYDEAMRLGRLIRKEKLQLVARSWRKGS